MGHTAFKLPLFRKGNKCDSAACDPGFKGDHTYKILWVRKNSEFLAECTGCGLQWRGKYREHHMATEVGKALMEQRPEIRLKRCRTLGGYVFEKGGRCE